LKDNISRKGKFNGGQGISKESEVLASIVGDGT
jgi:hypothetical protein